MLQAINIYAGLTPEQMTDAKKIVNYSISGGKAKIEKDFVDNYMVEGEINIWIKSNDLEDYILASDLTAAVWAKYHNSTMIIDIPKGPDGHFRWLGNYQVARQGGDLSPINRLYRYCNWVKGQSFVNAPSYVDMIKEGLIYSTVLNDSKGIETSSKSTKISEYFRLLANEFEKAGM